MRNIFLFIRRYFNFIFFVLVQSLALFFLFRYNRFHEAAFMRVANESTGWVNTRYDRVEGYFHLKETNEALMRQNETLLNQLKKDYSIPDTSATTIKDTIAYDTLGHFRQYVWRGAKVVGNTVGLQNNYITLQRVKNKGRKDMGVISANGIVGTVVNVSDNYAVVMSLLNRQSRVSARIKKTGETGTVSWDGESPLWVLMTNIPRSVPIAKGDTVVTSQYSSLFPQGVMVGTVLDIVNDKSSNFYTLRLKPAANFFTLEYAFVVDNLFKDEQKKLEEATKTNQ